MNPTMYEALDQLEDTHWWFEGRRRIVRQLLRRHLKPREARRILDVGCGTGGMFPLLSEFGQVEGAEASPDARARAERRFPQVRVSPCDLPHVLPDGSWDVVTAFDVIEHLDDPVASLEAMKRRLSADGQVVVTVPAFEVLWTQHDELSHHRRRYRRGLLIEHLSAAGLRVTWTSYFNTLLFPAIAGTRLLQRLIPPRDAATSDLTETAEPLNRLLTRLFGLERFALAVGQLPVGVSIAAVAERA